MLYSSLLFARVQKLILLISLALCFISTLCAGQNAEFSADVTSGCFPLTVRFTDSSTGGATSWSWNFDNGNTSTLQNPSAVYAMPGIYTVRLTVSNGSQTDTETKTGYIVVYDNPTVDFTVDNTSGCTPLTVKFKDLSTPGSGAITKWNWVFGDGGSSTDRNPTHIYTTPGNRSVFLKVTNQYGCYYTNSSPAIINVSGPNAAFTASNTLFCQAPATVQFTNTSMGNGTLSYTWIFDDGGTSQEVNPSHTYTDRGIYNAVLKTRDAQGCVSESSMTINVGSEGGLDLLSSASEVCLGQAINFSLQANTTVLSQEWNFGNGAFSTEASPTFTYAQFGSYTVTLKAMLQGKTCHSIVTKTIEVLADPRPAFTYTAGCDLKVTFANTSTAATRWEWYIGNLLYSTAQSFVYPFGTFGDHTVKLIAYNRLNCAVTLEKTVSVPGKPVAAFLPNKEQDCTIPSLSGCAPFTVQFENKSVSQVPFTSQWQFGDGSTSTEVNPAHTYEKGSFTVTLKITNSQGCTSTTTAKVTVSDIKPVAKFIINKTSVCAKEDVTFTNQSTNATFWCWDFGDGSSSIGSQAIHSYDKPGIYTVRLIAKNAGCSDSYEIVNAIEVKDPYVDFKIEKNCVDPYTISLQNFSTNYNTLQWDFGDGNTVNTNVGSHQYQTTGDYIVRLTGTNTATNCVVVVTAPVSIRDIRAEFVIDNPKPCKGAPVNFTDKSEFAVAWVWSFENNTNSWVQNPSTSFSQSGTYNVMLQAFDADGCLDARTISVDVLDIQGDFVYNATSTCDQLTVQFEDRSSANPPLLNWHWDFGDGETSTDSNPEHIYDDLGTYPVAVTLTNADGNCTFIKNDIIHFTNPVPDFSISKPGFCMKEQIQLTNRSRDAVFFSWDLGNGQSSTAVYPTTSYLSTGDYDITLSATDMYGCAVSVMKKAFISITKPVAAFEAFETSAECPPLISFFEDRSTGKIRKWNWDFGNQQYSDLADPVNTYLRAGTFDVKLVVTDANGCIDTTVVEKLVHVGGPSGSFSRVIPQTSCVYDTVAFAASTNNTVMHQWDFGDGAVEEKTIMDADHPYTHAGLFNVALVLIDGNGCRVAADGDVKVNVYDTTAIDFTYGECIFDGEDFVLQAEPQEELMWTWEVNGYTVGTGDRLGLALDTAGEHQIVLRAVNQYGCTSLTSHVVPVYSNLNFIPNIFTPNGDEYNNFFEIKAIEKSKWDINVYNRWGDPVYKKSSYANDWNGGDLAPGVYYYLLVNAFCPDRQYKGMVTIRK